MLYFVTLTYVRPRNEVDAHLPTHREWLGEHMQGGRIVAAGPLDDGRGGALLANCTSREELDRMLAQDSFSVHGLVDRQVTGFSPALRAAAWPEVPKTEAA